MLIVLLYIGETDCQSVAFRSYKLKGIITILQIIATSLKSKTGHISHKLKAMMKPKDKVHPMSLNQNTTKNIIRVGKQSSSE